MMGQEFGQNGKLVAFSNLFDYTSIETLKASLRLPVPQKYKLEIEVGENQKQIQKLVESIYHNNKKIQELYKELKKVKDEKSRKDIILDTNKIKAQRMNNLAQLITILYNNADRNNSNKIVLFENEELKDTVEWIRKQIDIHQNTIISPFQENEAYRNMVSAGIQNTVQDLVNMADAYEPITMSDLKINKGQMTDAMTMNQLNPLMKYIMQSQNMVGKKVIGIMAVGEKVNYNLDFYMNEKLRSKDIKFLDFSKTYTRIQGRYKYRSSQDENDITSVTKRMISDVNLSEVEPQIKEHFIVVDNVLQNFENRYQRKYDPASEKDQKIYNQLLDEECQNSGIGVNNKVDGMISELLSASTDNAKELILYQINCDTNMAKCYIHLLIMGFDIKDVVAFMTSPAVNLISKISKYNMWDSYVNELFENDIINIAEGILPVSNFIKGKVDSSDDQGNQTKVEAYTKYANSLGQNKEYLELIGMKKNDFDKLSTAAKIQTFIEAKILGKTNKKLSELIKKKSLQSRVFCDYVEQITQKIKDAVNEYSGDDMFEKFSKYKMDISQYKQVVEGGNEMSNLGNVLLGMNQGLPSSKEDLTSKIRMIKKIITDREKVFGIYNASFKKDETIKDIVKSLCQNNEYLDEKYVENILKQAKIYGLIEGIDFDKWIYDKQLTDDDIIQDASDLNIKLSKSIKGDKVKTYKQLVKEYYDIIKYSINAFDVIDVVPQFKSIIDLLQKVYTFDKQFSIRSNIIDIVTNKVLETQSFIDNKTIRAINNYARDLIITAFFNDDNNVYSFPVKAGMETLTRSYKNTILDKEENIDLNTSIGRASFKKVFINLMIDLKQGGKISEKYFKSEDFKKLQNNDFIKSLKINTDKYNIPYLVTSLDLNEINSSVENEREFNKLINGIEELKEIKINDISLYDWFVIYNLFVNQNQYGRERLTTFFKKYNSGTKSEVLTKFFYFESSLDYNYKTKELLEHLGFDINDVFIRMAPIVSRFNESRHKEPYIKVYNKEGVLELKKKFGKIYKVVSAFPNDSLLSEYDDSPTFEQLYNYSIYQSIKLTNQDVKINMARQLASRDPATLADALYQLIYKNKIRITTIDC